MATSIIAIDANAIRNLWAGGGAVMWDQFFNAGDHILVSQVVWEEIQDIPDGPEEDLIAEFDDWLARNGINRVEFDVPGIRDLNTNKLIPNNDAGDKVLRALFARGGDQAAADALQAAGIPTNGNFRLLTDDAKFLSNVYQNSNGFKNNNLRSLGHGIEPYRGVVEFLFERHTVGDLSEADLRSWVDGFEDSGRKLSLGRNNPIGDGKVFKLKEQFDLLRNYPALYGARALEPLRFLRTLLLSDQAGSVDPRFALKGGILGGAFAAASKFGIIGDVLAFSMVASTADELRANGDIKGANKLWTVTCAPKLPPFSGRVFTRYGDYYEAITVQRRTDHCDIKRARERLAEEGCVPTARH